MDAGPHQLAAWIAAHWQVAVMLAGALSCATGAALALLTKTGATSVARWMMGRSPTRHGRQTSPRFLTRSSGGGI